MNFATFKTSLGRARPPRGLSAALQALWWDAKGNWDKAHACAQDSQDSGAHRVHAYLHRKEGDPANAAYWYEQARQPVSARPLDSEWEAIAQALLAMQRP
jgi:hypothetical protein